MSEEAESLQNRFSAYFCVGSYHYGCALLEAILTFFGSDDVQDLKKPFRWEVKCLENQKGSADAFN